MFDKHYCAICHWAREHACDKVDSARNTCNSNMIEDKLFERPGQIVALMYLAIIIISSQILAFALCNQGWLTSGSIGDNSLLGDVRWGGLWGIDADFVADEHCKVITV